MTFPTQGLVHAEEFWTSMFALKYLHIFLFRKELSILCSKVSGQSLNVHYKMLRELLNDIYIKETFPSEKAVIELLTWFNCLVIRGLVQEWKVWGFASIWRISVSIMWLLLQGQIWARIGRGSSSVKCQTVNIQKDAQKRGYYQLRLV